MRGISGLNYNSVGTSNFISGPLKLRLFRPFFFSPWDNSTTQSESLTETTWKSGKWWVMKVTYENSPLQQLYVRLCRFIPRYCSRLCFGFTDLLECFMDLFCCLFWSHFEQLARGYGVAISITQFVTMLDKLGRFQVKPGQIRTHGKLVIWIKGHS